MLDRMGGGEPLRILADASEALGIEGRRDARKYTSLVPLNRLVDAVAPGERASAASGAGGIGRSGPVHRFGRHLLLWAENDASLQPAEELKPLSKNLSTLGSIGLRAWNFWNPERPRSGLGGANSRRRSTRWKSPSAEVRLAAIRPVRLLLETPGGARPNSTDMRLKLGTFDPVTNLS